MLLLLGGAYDVAGRERKLPLLSLIAHGKVEEITGPDALAVGVEELVLGAQHPTAGRKDVNVEAVLPIVDAARRKQMRGQVPLLIEVHTCLAFEREKPGGA